MGSLRTEESNDKYNNLVANGILDGGCNLCGAEPIKSFRLWKVIGNAFPYDRIAEIHHMIVPIRHVTEDGLSGEEKNELKKIKDEHINKNYEYIIEATHKKKSISEHFHLHLIVVKD